MTISSTDANIVTIHLIKEFMGLEKRLEKPNFNSKLAKLELKANIAQAEETHKSIQHFCYSVASAIFGFTVLVCSITIFTVPPSAIFFLSLSTSVYHGISWGLSLESCKIKSIPKPEEPIKNSIESALLNIMKGQLAYLHTNAPEARQTLNADTRKWIHILYASWNDSTIKEGITQANDPTCISNFYFLIAAVDQLVKKMNKTV